MDKFSFKNFSYFLIDYDGLLVDSERLYFESWCTLLDDEGRKICKKYHEGRHESEVYEKVKDNLLRPMTLKEVSKAKKEIYDQFISDGRLRLVKGMKNLLEVLKTIAPMSIVSNSTRDVVIAGLASTSTSEYFEELFCFSDEVSRKPSPDLYNLALSSLRLNPKSVLAFEDSISGIEAAKKAGIKVVCISSSSHAKDHVGKNNVVYYKSAIEVFSSMQKNS